jgi:nucleoid DNA-binding protein
MFDKMIGLTKEEIEKSFASNSQLTVQDLASIIEANNQRITEDLKKITTIDELEIQLQNLFRLTNTHFE